MRIFLLLVLSYFYLCAQAHIFLYHRFDDNRYPATNTSTQQLREHFEYFKNNHYKVVSIEAMIEKLEKNQEVPSHWVALTIDDAYKSFYEHGLALFKEYQYPFSLYTQVAGRSNKNSSISDWEQLKEIKKYGSVELHSYSHDHLTHMSEEALRKDTQKAIDIFKKNMGYKPTIFAYPFGEYDQNVQKVLREFKFKGILNQNSGSVNQNTQTYDIPRIALVGDINIQEKLKYTTLDVQWLEPKSYPNDSILKSIKARVNPSIKNVKLYITSHGWRDIKVNDGIIDVKLNLELLKPRTRVIIGTDYYNIANKLLIKNKEKSNAK